MIEKIWVKWEIVCKNKEHGGLGIKEVSSYNRALLGNGNGG